MLNENSEDLQNKMEDWQNKIFNFEEALERLQVTQKQVEEFKEKARKSKEIPKDIQDELVCFLGRVLVSFVKFLTIKFLVFDFYDDESERYG